jgi:hypothetical protein
VEVEKAVRSGTARTRNSLYKEKEFSLVKSAKNFADNRKKVGDWLKP